MASQLSLKEHWSKGADAYSAFSGEGGLLPLHKKVVQLLLDSGVGNSAVILDIACGDGEPSCSLASRLPNGKVTATDFAEGMVEKAKGKADALGLQNIRFAVADAMDLSEFAANSFDAVTCVAALFMVPDYSKALKEFNRVLKSNGKLFVTTFGKPEETNLATALQTAKMRVAPTLANQLPRASNIDPSRLASPEVLKEILKEAGFTSIDIEKFNLQFKYGKESFKYPDGHMLIHPMVTMIAAQIEMAGISDGVPRLLKELDSINKEQGYADDQGNYNFPQNLALIAIAHK